MVSTAIERQNRTALQNDLSRRSGDWNRKKSCVTELESMATEQESMVIRPRGTEPVPFQGDVTIIDPFNLFFQGPESATRLAKMRRNLEDLQQEGHSEFIVMYLGLMAYILSSELWDMEAAFEVSRNGSSLGVDEMPSKFIAVVPKTLVDILVTENGESTRIQRGVPVKGVDGLLITSGDGDFVISGSKNASGESKVSRWIEDECVRNADILCAAGGRWTFCDDSSDDEADDEDIEFRDAQTNGIHS